MDLSIVTTLYNSSSYIDDFYRRIRKAAEGVATDIEIIFVNDGSPDYSLDVAKSIYEKENGIKIIDLSRNFGQHKAMMVGLAHATGKRIFLIDCDLEEDPELLNLFYQEMDKTCADAIYGVQEMRAGGILKRVSGNLFYGLFNLFSSYPVPSNPTNTRLMTQRYVKSLLQHQEREFYLAGLWAMTGYAQEPLKIKKHYKGHSTYTLGRKLTILVNAITSFSNQPLNFIFYLGSVIVTLSTTAAFVLIIRRIFLHELLAGWSSLIVSIWLLGGLTIFTVGILGIYLSKVFIETKHRPYAIIRSIYDKQGPIKID